MNKSNINYPHPVLSISNDDYVSSSFDIDLIEPATLDGDYTTFTIGYELSCEGLKALIEAGKAKVAVFMDSVVAEYRHMESFPSDATTMKVTISRGDINRSLQIKGYIIASEAIAQFTLPEHNKEHFRFPISIRKGDILGIATHSFNVPLESYDPLADRPSIFSIRKQSENPKEEVTADFSESKIIIWLNEETHQKYRTLYQAPDARGVLSAFFAAPVLVDALYYIKNMSEDERLVYEDKKWFQVINHRLKELKIDLEMEGSMTKVANMILPRIFSSSVESLTQLCNELLKGGERNEA